MIWSIRWKWVNQLESWVLHHSQFWRNGGIIYKKDIRRETFTMKEIEFRSGLLCSQLTCKSQLVIEQNNCGYSNSWTFIYERQLCLLAGPHFCSRRAGFQERVVPLKQDCSFSFEMTIFSNGIFSSIIFLELPIQSISDCSFVWSKPLISCTTLLYMNWPEFYFNWSYMNCWIGHLLVVHRLC